MFTSRDKVKQNETICSDDLLSTNRIETLEVGGLSKTIGWTIPAKRFAGMVQPIIVELSAGRRFEGCSGLQLDMQKSRRDGL